MVGNRGWGVGLDTAANGRPYFVVSDTSTSVVRRNGASVMGAGLPCLLRMRYDGTGGEQSIWVNGVQDDGSLSGSVPSTIASDGTTPQILRAGYGYYYHGYAAVLAVFPRALSDAEAEAIEAEIIAAADLYVLEETSASPDVNGHQGVATDGTYFYVFDTGAIRKYDASWTLVSQNTSPFTGLDASLVHQTDGCYYNGYLYVEVDEYPATQTAPRMLKFDASDLSRVADYDLAGRFCSGVGIDTDNEYLLGATTDGSTFFVYRWDLADLSYVDTIDFGTPAYGPQGISYRGGLYFVTLSSVEGLMLVCDPAMGVARPIYRHFVDSGQISEGLDFTTGALLWMIDEGANEIVHVYGVGGAGAPTNTQPDAPTISHSALTATTVTLTGSAFSDSDGDGHLESQWQVATDAGFASLVEDVTSGVDLVSHDVSGLTQNTAYYARLRYRDDSGTGVNEWSDWSASDTFSTPANPPDAVGCTASNVVATSVRVMPAGPYHHPDGEAQVGAYAQVRRAFDDHVVATVHVGGAPAYIDVSGLYGSVELVAYWAYEGPAGIYQYGAPSAAFTTPNPIGPDDMTLTAPALVPPVRVSTASVVVTGYGPDADIENTQTILASHQSPDTVVEADQIILAAFVTGVLPNPCPLEWWDLTLFGDDDVTPILGTADVDGNPIEPSFTSLTVEDGGVRPYLDVPDRGPDESVDPLSCTARISAMTVRLLDKRQACDQATGILTGLLPDAENYNQLVGRRVVVRRLTANLEVFVLCDGIVSSVRMRDDLVTYDVYLKDRSERLRKTSLFQKNNTISVFPEGLRDGYGDLGQSTTTPEEVVQDRLYVTVAETEWQATKSHAGDPDGADYYFHFYTYVNVGQSVDLEFSVDDLSGGGWQSIATLTLDNSGGIQGVLYPVDQLANLPGLPVGAKLRVTVTGPAGEYTVSLLPSVRSTYTTEVTERTFIIPTADYATATAHIVTSFGVLGGYLEVTGAHASDPISDAMASIPLEANPAASGQTVWLYAHYLPKIMLQWRRPGDAGWNYIDGSTLYSASVAVFTRDSSGAPLNVNVYGGDLNGTTILDGETIEFRVLYNGPASDEWPYFWDDGTAGDLYRRVLDGEFSGGDPLGVVYDPAAFDALALATPYVRFIAREVAGDALQWVTANILLPFNILPVLGADKRLAPILGNFPDGQALDNLDVTNVVELEASWEAGDSNAVGEVRFTLYREYVLPLDPDAEVEPALWQRWAEQEVIIDEIDAPSATLIRSEPLEIDPVTVRDLDVAKIADVLGALAPETLGGAPTDAAYILASRRARDILAKFKFGAPVIDGVRARRSDVAVRDATNGTWFLMDLPWIPNYETGERGGAAIAQLLSLQDAEYTFRTLSLCVIPPDVGGTSGGSTDPLPVDPGPTGPSFSLAFDAQNRLVVSVSNIPAGQRARVQERGYFDAVNPPPAGDPYWLDIGTLASDGDVTTAAKKLIPGVFWWVRVRMEADGQRPSDWLPAQEISLVIVPQLINGEVLINDDDGSAIVDWFANNNAAGMATLGVRIDYEVADPGVVPTYPNYRDAPMPGDVLAGNTINFGNYRFPAGFVGPGKAAYVRLVPYPLYPISGTPGAPLETWDVRGGGNVKVYDAWLVRDAGAVLDGSEMVRQSVHWWVQDSYTGLTVRIQRSVNSGALVVVASGISAVDTVDDSWQDTPLPPEWIHDAAHGDPIYYVYLVELVRTSDGAVVASRYTDELEIDAFKLTGGATSAPVGTAALGD